MARITKAPEERKKEIISVAKNLFCKHGFNKTMITDIANELGVAQGLIYHYFKSKTDILYAVADELANENVIILKDIISKYNGTAIQCLHLILEQKYCVGEEYENLFLSLKENKGALEHIHTKITVSVAPILISLIEQGNKDGSWSCKYPKESAYFILYGINGYSFNIKDIQETKNLQMAFKDIITRILGVNT